MKKLTEMINEQVNVGVQPLNTELLFITKGEQQVGSLLLIYNENKASIYSVEVLNNHRGHGYGKRLVENAIARCKQRMCESIELNTEIDNTVANNLYISMGFELRGLKDSFNNYIKPLN
jgi:ribosomal protein S18 acetylase RimI-like enzyme